MPLVDTAADLLLRTTRRAAWLEHVVDIAGWLVAPISLVTLAVTGELMAYGWRMTGLPAFATLRGMHVLAGGVLFTVILYRGTRGGWRLYRRGVTRREVMAFAARAVHSAEPFVRTGTWTCLLLLVVTGLGRHARLRYGWSPLPPGNPALWDVIHVTTVPYFYGFLVLEAYLRVRRWLPALRDYLVRQY
jgi:hypothetical protein